MKPNYCFCCFAVLLQNIKYLFEFSESQLHHPRILFVAQLQSPNSTYDSKPLGLFVPAELTRQALRFEYVWRNVAVQLQCESKKIAPRGPDIFSFFHKQLRICNRFFTHLLNVPIFARLHIFIQLSPILTKLCRIKRDYRVQIICAKCPKHAKTHAFRRLRKSLIALLIVVCGKSL